jgi:hypothetical protein
MVMVVCFSFSLFSLKILRIIAVRRIWGVDYYLWKNISIFYDVAVIITEKAEARKQKFVFIFGQV